MRKIVLDTNHLIDAWHGRWPTSIRGRPAKESEQGAKEAVSTFASMFKTTKTIVIVTPSRIEFLGGTIKSELRLAEFFLDQFELLDQGHVIDDDWTQAERLAKRVLQAGKHKHLGDCLIKAIALRLNAEVKTHDKGFPR